MNTIRRGAGAGNGVTRGWSLGRGRVGWLGRLGAGVGGWVEKGRGLGWGKVGWGDGGVVLGGKVKEHSISPDCLAVCPMCSLVSKGAAQHQNICSRHLSLHLIAYHCLEKDER